MGNIAMWAPLAALFAQTPLTPPHLQEASPTLASLLKHLPILGILSRPGLSEGATQFRMNSRSMSPFSDRGECTAEDLSFIRTGS